MDRKTSVHPVPGPAEPVPGRHAGRLRRLYQRSRFVLLVALGILLAFVAFAAYRAVRPLPAPVTETQFNAMVARALQAMPPKPYDGTVAYQVIRPSLVTVVATIPEKGTSDREAGGYPRKAQGGGVVIADNGTILTSLHIVQGASGVDVTFANGSHSPADIVVQEPANDLAVLKAQVIPDDLQPATLASSATLNPGDEVYAAGNPFGLAGSFSGGVVSGLHREYDPPNAKDAIKDLIQFDASVNPGNSGGPLLDRAGEVVGIVMGLLNPTEQHVFIGIGFAVPIETAAAAAGPPWW